MTANSVRSAASSTGRVQAGLIGRGMLLLGAALALLSFVAMSWYSISGPGVITSDQQDASSSNGSVLLVNPDEGASHSLLVWVLLVAGVVAAVMTQVAPTSRRKPWAAVAVILSAACVVGVIASVLVLRWAVGGEPVPPGTTVTPHAGLWVALAGLALVGASVIAGLRAVAPTRHSS
jgi:hypothetical protein